MLFWVTVKLQGGVSALLKLWVSYRKRLLSWVIPSDRKRSVGGFCDQHCVECQEPTKSSKWKCHAWKLCLSSQFEQYFFPFCLVSSVFDPGETEMDMGFLFLHSNGKKSPFLKILCQFLWEPENCDFWYHHSQSGLWCGFASGCLSQMSSFWIL